MSAQTPAESDYARGYRMNIVELESLREQLAESAATIPVLVAALKWLTNLCAGVSKDGGSDISQQEWNECNESARAALVMVGEK